MNPQPLWTARIIVAGALLCATAAAAETPASGNLLGQRGLLRSSAATPQPGGVIGFGTDFQYFKASGFLATNQEHSRMVNTYTINWAPIRFLEAALAMHVTSDNSVTGKAEELQVAVGDPEVAIKGGAELGAGFSVGGLLDLRFPSGAGFFQASAAATNVFFAALASWSGGSKLPLAVHVNLGFLRDGSSNLFPDPKKLTLAQRYAAQVSSFNRLVTRLGIQYVTTYIGPFVELSLEPLLGDGNPGFGKSPTVLSLGLHAWPTKKKGLQLLAAMDIGLTGVGDGSAVVTTPDKYAFAIPRWNLVLQMSYRFDAFAEPETKVVHDGGNGGGKVTPPTAAPKTGVIRGTVLDAKTEKPVWNARITVEGQEASSLAVNPGDGAFRSYRVPSGKHSVTAVADGYTPLKIDVDVAPDGQAEARFRLVSRTSIVPGTLRGTIKAVSGKLQAATVLIPEIDQTIQIEADGQFSVTLKPGEYKVVVSARGLRTQTKTIRILEGSTVILNVDLYR